MYIAKLVGIHLALQVKLMAWDSAEKQLVKHYGINDKLNAANGPALKCRRDPQNDWYILFCLTGFGINFFQTIIYRTNYRTYKAVKWS